MIQTNCDSAECPYVYNPLYEGCYDPENDDFFVANDLAMADSVNMDLRVGECTGDIIVLCDICAETHTIDARCCMCKRGMMDEWIGKDVIECINTILGEGSWPVNDVVCRRCVDYKDTDDFRSFLNSEEDGLDEDIVACGREFKGKWIPLLNYDNEIRAKDCPTEDEVVVDAKVRRILVNDLLGAMRSAYGNIHEAMEKASAETDARISEVALQIRKIIPTISEEESITIVSTRATKWITGLPSHVKNPASLLCAAFDYE